MILKCKTQNNWAVQSSSIFQLMPARMVGGLGENGYMYMHGWVPLLFIWNYHNIVFGYTPIQHVLGVKKKTNWEEMSRGWHFQDVYIIEVPGYLNYPEHLWVFAVLFPHEFKDEGSFFIMAHLCVNMGIFFNIMISVNTHSFFSLLVFSKYIKWCYYSAESLLAFKLESTNVWLLIKMI